MIEDLHWIDSASEELLGKIVDSEANLRLLLLTTRRPEYTFALGRSANSQAKRRVKKAVQIQFDRILNAQRQVKHLQLLGYSEMTRTYLISGAPYGIRRGQREMPVKSE